VAWLSVLALGFAAGLTAAWLWERQQRARHTRSQPPRPLEIVTRTPEEIAQAERMTKNLLAAFRSDEYPVSEDVERQDRRLLINALQLVADHLGAYEAVLWRPYEDESGRLLPMAWSRGSEPPALTEADRALIEWSAAHQKEMFSGTDDAVRQLSVGASVGELRGAVSVHYRETPTYRRSEISFWLQRHATQLAELSEIVRTRASLARSNRRLRAMIRTATTLQASRDPAALEEILMRDTCVVTAAAWAILVRWDAATRLGTWGRATPEAPAFDLLVTARQGSVVGNACLDRKYRVNSDTRPMLAARESLFDDTPLPSGTRSLIVVPIQRSEDDAPVGALVCGHPERGTFQEGDAMAALTLGKIAAAALETAWAVKDETQRARTDQLTGLANRRAFDEAFVKMISETDRYGGSSALVLLDIDFFKQVNDTSGHEAGDRVLVELGGALSEARRTTDFVARLGGEEMALLLPQTDATGAVEVAERLRQRIAEMRVKTPAGTLQVTASFGVAVYSARSGTSGSLFDRADKALYAAKHGGRNRVELAPVDAPWSA
jgi:diguanylate cyclase (GGDEF)-like protein